MNDKDYRVQLSRQLTTYALIAIAIVVALILAGQVYILVDGTYSKDRADAFSDVGKYVLGVILPVVSAWVGTVLAFYFSRENYESAARNTSDLVRQITTSADKLRATPVRHVMISMAEANTLTSDNPAAVVLKDLLATHLKDYNRLPVLTKDGIAVCILHKSTLNDFLVTHFASGTDALTLQTLLDEPAYAVLVKTKGMGFAKSQENLDVIKRIMDTEPRCLDVFITKDGTDQGIVLGWITNAILLQESQV